MKKALLFLITAFMLLSVFSGCSKDVKAVSVYFKAAGSNSLCEEKRNMNNAEPNVADMAKFAVEELIKGPSNETHTAVISKDAKLLKLEVKDSVATVNLSAHYAEKKGVEEILLQHALVKTLCSIDGIESIVILTEGKPIVNSEGKEIGRIGLKDFIDPEDTQIDEKMTVKLYFPSTDDAKLAEESRSVEMQKSLSPERTVINELINGPSNKNLSPAVPAGTKLLGVETKDGVCFVNFSSEFVSNAGSGSMQTTLILYSIVNSLCELENVESVQILVNGETGVEFGNFVLDIPYDANSDFIGKSK